MSGRSSPRRPWQAYVNERTDFPDDEMTPEERALIELDERRRQDGLPQIEDPADLRRELKRDRPRHRATDVKHAAKHAAKHATKQAVEPDHFDDDREYDDDGDHQGDHEDSDTPQRDVSHVWLRAQRMTQTELLLRLGLYLISSEHICGHVSIALRGRELTRRNAPMFPLAAFMEEHHVKRMDQPQLADDWRGEYCLRHGRFWLKLTSDPCSADLEVEVGAGDRLLVFAGAGMLEPTRSPAEHRAVQNLLGRAMLHDSTNSRDLVAIAVPRSAKFRRLRKSALAAPRVTAMGLSVVLVDRSGQVSGLPFLETGD